MVAASGAKGRRAAAHKPSGEPSNGGERQDHPPVAEYAENEQAYPKPACGYALQGKRSIQASHRCNYPFRYGAAQVIFRPVRSRRHQEHDAGVRGNDRTAECGRRMAL